MPLLYQGPWTCHPCLFISFVVLMQCWKNWCIGPLRYAWDWIGILSNWAVGILKNGFWPRILRKPLVPDKKSNSVSKTVPWCTSAQPRPSLTHNLIMTYLPTWQDLQFVSFLFLPSLSFFSLHWDAPASFVHWPLSWTLYLLCACSAALWNVLEDVRLRGFCSAGSQTPSSG